MIKEDTAGHIKFHSFQVSHQLPGGLRYVRLQRDPLQPRESTERGDLRHEKSEISPQIFNRTQREMAKFNSQITRSVAKISLGHIEYFELGNLDSQVFMAVLKNSSFS